MSLNTQNVEINTSCDEEVFDMLIEHAQRLIAKNEKITGYILDGLLHYGVVIPEEYL